MSFACVPARPMRVRLCALCVCVVGAGRARGVQGSARHDSWLSGLTDYVRFEATPAEISLMARVRQYVRRFGIPSTYGYFDEIGQPGVRTDYPCAREGSECVVPEFCYTSGQPISVYYGKGPGITEELTKITLDTPPHGEELTLMCNMDAFGSDPSPGNVKNCWVECMNKQATVNKVDQCKGHGVKDGNMEALWARIPMCKKPGASMGVVSPIEEQYQQSLAPICEDDVMSSGMQLHIDCRFQRAFAIATGIEAQFNERGLVQEDLTRWVDRAYVTFFKGEPTGMTHSMMVSNLIRSVHMFSNDTSIPIIVYVFEEEAISIDWDPVIFPRLIVVHGNSINSMGNRYVSFNFNKFRSMFLRVKTGIQLDADMIIAPNCDLLFAASEREITPEYAVPIFPVHWMTRYRNPEHKEGYDVYAVDYPGDGATKGSDALAKWPARRRWVHAHPTWTHHALPWLVDTFVMKISHSRWAQIPRVAKALGGHLQENPPIFMMEDEDLM